MLPEPVVAEGAIVVPLDCVFICSCVGVFWVGEPVLVSSAIAVLLAIANAASAVAVMSFFMVIASLGLYWRYGNAGTVAPVPKSQPMVPITLMATRA
jgi:hypothetical protein